MKAVCVNLHATCLRIGAASAPFGASPYGGVLLLGRSGTGKSDLALRLIAAGAELVADDRVELFVSQRHLCARPPTRIAGLLEARGVGVIELPFAEVARVVLVVELGKKVERLPKPLRFGPPGLRLPVSAQPPLVRIASREASAPAKIAAAVAAFELRLLRNSAKSV
jgi:serine kinase of HPr protein (carbohydrate metabolism regulator)